MTNRFKPSFSLTRLALALALLFLVFQLGLSYFTYARMVVSALGFPFTIDYGEGPLLDQTLRLAAGENIYHNDFNQPPFTISNYPPLFPLVQAPFAWVFGPALWYGRLLSLLSALAAALFLGLTLHTLTGDRLAAAVGGLLLLAFPFLQFWSVLNRIDSLALGLSWAAIFVAVRYTGLAWASGQVENKPWAIPLAAGLFVASIFTRQSYALAGPFAVFVMLLFMRQARQAIRLALITGGASALLFLLLNGLTAGGFYLNIVTANVNPFYWNTVRHNAELLWENTVFLIVIIGLFVLAGRILQPARSWLLAVPYLLAAAASAITIGKDGSNVNYLLELAAALSFAGAAALAWFGTYRRRHLQAKNGSTEITNGSEDAANGNVVATYDSGAATYDSGAAATYGSPAATHDSSAATYDSPAAAYGSPAATYGSSAATDSRGRWLQVAILVALAVQVGQLTAWGNGDFIHRVQEPIKQRAPLEQLFQVVRETDGILLADEHMALIPLAGKRLYFQPFEYKMLHEGGLWDEEPFLQDIRDNRFSLILWYTPGTWPAVESRWTPATQSLVPVAYRLDKFTAYNKVFRPRR